MELSVTINPDKGGYTGRECPDCEKYFKIKCGTGLPDATDCHCPYCNHVGLQDEFWTKQQIEYAQSVVLNKFSGDLLKQMKQLERKPDRNAFMSIGITVKGRPTPITYYSEQDLEELVTCATCTLEYAIYGVFGYCPDCGIHNSQQIVHANFDLVIKILNLAVNEHGDIKAKLIENALEDAVSAFDGFGREHCSGLGYNVSFQNINSAKNRLLDKEGLDISSGLNVDEWGFTCDQFQKRHLLAHKLGIVDEEYIRKTSHTSLLIGRKVPISETEVKKLISHLIVVSGNLYDGVTRC